MQYEEWIKFNYDTGAATTALLVELAEGLPLHKLVSSSLRTGHDIPTFCRAKFHTETSLATNARWQDMSQKYTNHLHLRVKSASTTFVFEKFEALIPKQSRVAEDPRRNYHRLCQLHGYHRILPYHVRRTGKLQMVPVETNQAIVMNAPDKYFIFVGKRPASALEAGWEEWQMCKPQGCTS